MTILLPIVVECVVLLPEQCIMDLSPTITLSPIEIALTSPLMTAPYQTEELFPTFTFPITAADCEIKLPLNIGP